MRAVAKSYMRKDFLIYEEMRKYLIIQYMRRPLVIYVWLCNPSLLDFLIYKENFILFFTSVLKRKYGMLSSWNRAYLVFNGPSFTMGKQKFYIQKFQNIPGNRLYSLHAFCEGMCRLGDQSLQWTITTSRFAYYLTYTSMYLQLKSAVLHWPDTEKLIRNSLLTYVRV